LEYLTYILIILVILCLFVVALRNTGQSLFEVDEVKLMKKVRGRPVGKQTTTGSAETEPALAVRALNKETIAVPTPWGWPGYDERSTAKGLALANENQVNGVSDSLHRLIDHLLREKQTVENQEYLLKKDASLRALFEDRYGRARVAPDAGRRKLKIPLLPEPGKPLNMNTLRTMKTPWGW
jgi:hypothetical protein